MVYCKEKYVGGICQKYFVTIIKGAAVYSFKFYLNKSVYFTHSMYFAADNHYLQLQLQHICIIMPGEIG